MPAMRSALLPGALALLVAACATPPPAAHAPPSAPRSAAAPAARPTLAAEQRRLSALFDGTPVVFAMQADGSLRVTVPRYFCFDRGAVRVKPPLAAVLDRLAKSQLDAPSKFRLSAPADPETRGPALVRDRGVALRDYLMGQRIAAERLQLMSAVQTEWVEIVVMEGSAH